jgi:glycosyltransferase involved in cell wall biosynthesis
VLVAHNRYRSGLPSGENATVERDVAALAARGVAVDVLLADSDDIEGFGLGRRLTLPGRPTWSAETRRRFRTTVAAHRPDLVHLHNPYPLLSPAVVRWAVAAGLPIVQSVHNVRHACLAGTFARDGRTCRDCVGRRLPWPGVAHGCYRGGRAPSLALAVAATAHRSTWTRVDRFIAVSDWIAGELAAAGLPAERTVVRPNGVVDPGPPGPPGAAVLFAGRLSREKGVGLLLDVWADPDLRPPAPLHIAGDGPLRPAVEAAASGPSGVEFLGRLDPEGVAGAIDEAAMVAVPSQTPEALPTVVIEAFARGRAVVAGSAGALPGMVDRGVGAVADSGPSGLSQALRMVLVDAAARGTAARERYLETYTEDRSVDRLLAIYADVLA